MFFIPANNDESEARVAFSRLSVARMWATRCWGEPGEWIEVSEVPEGFDLDPVRAIMATDYHGDDVDFFEGDEVTWVDPDTGDMHVGTVANIADGATRRFALLLIAFADGSEGSATANLCFHHDAPVPELARGAVQPVDEHGNQA